MDQLRVFYDSPQLIQLPKERVGEEKLDVRTYAHHALNPVIHDRLAGYFPLQQPYRDVKYKVEPAPTVMFQRSPRFHYFPQHSNLDVDLEEQG